MNPLRPHRRQFVAGPEPVRVFPDWLVARVGSTWLSHCPELPVHHVRDRSGSDWALLGNVVECSGGERAPPARLAELEAEAPETDGWAGRWVLIGRDHVTPDAAALLQCLHGADRRGRTWVSSSPRLIADRIHPDGEPPRHDSRRLRYESGISWTPPPRTAIAGVRRLLPSQVLDLRSGARPARSILGAHAGRSGDDLDRLAETLVGAVEALATATDGPIHLGLSAGFDSRVVLAAAIASGVEVDVFTRMTPRMSTADREIPAELLRAAGMPHALLRAEGPSEERRRAGEVHAPSTLSSGDAQLFRSGTRGGLSGTLIGGWCLGGWHAEGWPAPRFGSVAIPERIAPIDTTSRTIARVWGESADSPVVEDIAEWLAWVLEAPEPGLDWRDRFAIEQRLAGWLAAKEQLYDLEDVVRIPVANSAVVYSCLAGLADAKRGGAHKVEIVRRLAPQLAELPYNPPESHFGRVRPKLRRVREDPRVVVEAGKRAARRLRSRWRAFP